MPQPLSLNDSAAFHDALLNANTTGAHNPFEAPAAAYSRRIFASPIDTVGSSENPSVIFLPYLASSLCMHWKGVIHAS